MADINIVQDITWRRNRPARPRNRWPTSWLNNLSWDCRWEGDVLRFERSGVNGSLTLEPNQARLQIALGFLFGAFASQIEAKVAAKMRQVFVP